MAVGVLAEHPGSRPVHCCRGCAVELPFLAFARCCCRVRRRRPAGRARRRSPSRGPASTPPSRLLLKGTCGILVGGERLADQRPPRSCCTSTASSTPAAGERQRRRSARSTPRPGRPGRGTSPGRHRLPGPRRPAVHADRGGGRRRSARPTWACAAPSRDLTRVDEALAAVGMSRASRPGPAPPVVRPAPPGRGGHRARHAPGDPGARRAVVATWTPPARRELAQRSCATCR